MFSLQECKKSLMSTNNYVMDTQMQCWNWDWEQPDCDPFVHGQHNAALYNQFTVYFGIDVCCMPKQISNVIASAETKCA